MKEEKIESKLAEAVKEASSIKPFEFEVDKKIEGALFLRVDGKAEFYPKSKRDGKGGMTTTNKSDNFVIQESVNKVKVTISFEKGTLTFNKVMKSLTRLMTTFQNMKII